MLLELLVYHRGYLFDRLEATARDLGLMAIRNERSSEIQEIESRKPYIVTGSEVCRSIVARNQKD